MSSNRQGPTAWARNHSMYSMGMEKRAVGKNERIYCLANLPMTPCNLLASRVQYLFERHLSTSKHNYSLSMSDLSRLTTKER